MSQEPPSQSGPSDPSEYSTDDKVGYCRPPRAHQFQPGQSGNKAGRPKKKLTLYEELIGLADEQVAVQIDGKNRRMSRHELILLRVLAQAQKGDHKAIALYLQLRQSGQGDDGSASAAIMTPEEMAQVLEGFARRAGDSGVDMLLQDPLPPAPRGSK